MTTISNIMIINAPKEESPVIVPIEYVKEEDGDNNEACVGHYFNSLFEEGDHFESKVVEKDGNTF